MTNNEVETCSNRCSPTSPPSATTCRPSGAGGQHRARLRPRPRPLRRVGDLGPVGRLRQAHPAGPRPVHRLPPRREARPAERRPAPRLAQDVLPLPAAGGAGGRRGRGPARLAQALGAGAAGALARGRGRSCLPPPRPATASTSATGRILETLYATGCRASEVVGLRVAGRVPGRGVLQCLGKGSKQRVVPLGRPAVEALRTYLSEGRPLVAAARRGGRPGARLRQQVRPAAQPRIFLWALVKKYCRRAGLPATVEPAHAAAQLRHARAGRRRRPADGAGTARPRLDPDDAALHARGPRPAQGHPPPVPPARQRGGGEHAGLATLRRSVPRTKNASPKRRQPRGSYRKLNPK